MGVGRAHDGAAGVPQLLVWQVGLPNCRLQDFFLPTSQPCPLGKGGCWCQLSSPLRHIQDPASQRLTWNKSPKSVLVIKKIRDASLLQPFKELCMYLMEVRWHGACGGVTCEVWGPCA